MIKGNAEKRIKGVCKEPAVEENKVEIEYRMEEGEELINRRILIYCTGSNAVRSDSEREGKAGRRKGSTIGPYGNR